MATEKKMSVVTVRCGGHLHRIGLTDGGALVALDHQDPADRALVALAGGCKCRDIVRGGVAGDKAKSLWRERHDAACVRRRDRVMVRMVVKMATRPEDRLRSMIVGRVDSAMRKCHYREAQSSWAGGNHFCSVDIGAGVSASGHSTTEWSSNGKWSGKNSHHDIQVRRDWLSRVFRRGVAVVGGMLVVDVTGEMPDGALAALMVVAGRGFDLRVAPAVLRRGEGDKWVAKISKK